MKQRLWHISRDTGGLGACLLDLLIETELVDNSEQAKDLFKKGQVSSNRTVIKDVLYKLPKGSHVIALSKKPKIRITII